MASRQAARMSGGGARLGTGYGMGTLAECRAAGEHRAHRGQSRPLAVLLRAPGMKASNNTGDCQVHDPVGNYTDPKQTDVHVQLKGFERGARHDRVASSLEVPGSGGCGKGRLRSAAPGLRCACYSAPETSPRLACTLSPPGYSGGEAPQSCTPST